MLQKSLSSLQRTRPHVSLQAYVLTSYGMDVGKLWRILKYDIFLSYFSRKSFPFSFEFINWNFTTPIPEKQFFLPPLEISTVALPPLLEKILSSPCFIATHQALDVIDGKIKGKTLMEKLKEKLDQQSIQLSKSIDDKKNKN